MKLTHNTGRIIGYSIIVMFLLGIFALMGLDEKIIVKGDTEATLQNISLWSRPPKEYPKELSACFRPLVFTTLRPSYPIKSGLPSREASGKPGLRICRLEFLSFPGNHFMKVLKSILFRG